MIFKHAQPLKMKVDILRSSDAVLAGVSTIGTSRVSVMLRKRSGGALLNPWPGHQIPALTFVLDFLSSSAQIPGQYLDYTTTSFFHHPVALCARKLYAALITYQAACCFSFSPSWTVSLG
jgi:hypothetical protein